MNKYCYKGQIITASSKQDAIHQIIAGSKKPNIDIKVVNKWAKKNMNITDDGLGKDHWKNPKNGEVYYTYKAAKRLAKKLAGYHLPSFKEWDELMKSCGCICVNPRKKDGWRDYNNSKELKKKLDIRFVGWYNSKMDDFFNIGKSVYFWTSTEEGNKDAAGVRIDKTDDIGTVHGYGKDGISVRLVKD